MKALGSHFLSLFLPLFYCCIVALGTAQTPKAAIDSLVQKKDDFSLTLPYIDSVIVAHPELQKHPLLLYCKGGLFFDDENYALAIECYLAAKNNVKDYKIHFDILNNLGVSYDFSQQYDLAIKAYGESKKLAEQHQNKEDIDYAYENILITKIEVGDFEAIQEYERHFKAKDYGNDHCLKMENLGMVVTSYIEQKHYRLAEKLLQNTSIKTDTTDDCPMVKAMYYENWAYIYLHKKNYAMALEYLDAVPLHEITIPRDKVETYEAYNAVYKQMGDSEQADKYSDSIANVFKKNLERLNRDNAAHVTHTALTQQEDKRLMKRLRLVLIYLGIGLVALLIWAFSSKKYRKRMRKQLQLADERYTHLWTTHQLSLGQLDEIKAELEKQASINDDVGIGSVLKRIYLHLNTNGISEHKLVNHTKNNVLQLLAEKAPFLSEQEKLVCFFLSLNLSHKKIAALLKKTEKSIDSYKYRINQKVKNNTGKTLRKLLDIIKSSSKLGAQ